MRFECAVFDENSRSGRYCGEVAAVVDRPVGCSGSASQNPCPSEPAATLPCHVLSGFVIQNVAGVASVGSSRLPGGGTRVSTPRFPLNVLPVSAPSSRKKP